MPDEIVDASAEQLIAVIEQMADLPWPADDETLEWELGGLEGATTWMAHALPLASTSDVSALAAWLAPLLVLADQRWHARHIFDATQVAHPRGSDPALHDRRSAPAGVVGEYGVDHAVWWRVGDDAVMLIDTSEVGAEIAMAVVLVMPADWLGPPGAEEQALDDSLVKDLLSGDGRRVLHAVWEVIGTRDPAILGPVATALPAVERATAELELGGALASNGRNLEHAFQRVALFRNGECLCAAYLSHQFYEPKKEERKGHVRIAGEVPIDWQWEPIRICVCSDCGKPFQVEQGEYHYTWWKWTELGAKLPHGADLLGAALANPKAEARYASVRVLLDLGGFTVGHRDSEGRTELHLLFGQADHDLAADLEIATRLIDLGADVNAVSKRSGLVLVDVLRMKYSDDDLEPIYDLWFEQPRLDFQTPSSYGNTPLSVARNNPDRAKILQRMERYLADRS